MADIIQALKTRARILHKSIKAGNPASLKTIRKLPDLRKLDDKVIIDQTRRRHCLSIVARQCGFDGWSHLTAVLEHGDYSKGAGTFMYPRRCWAHWNVWFADYDEAAGVREKHGGLLLGYKNQYLIVDDDYIRELGLDPDDADLAATGRDWVRPKDKAARTRLLAILVQTALAENPLPQNGSKAA